DDGSGVAVVLELARLASGRSFGRTVRFVAFFNEESVQPWGARVYAEACRQRGDNIVGVIVLETIGYYADQPHSQRYPFPFSLLYPSTGNFIGFVGNGESRPLIHSAVRSFREHAKFPSAGGAMPGFVSDAARSDHQAFWRQGYP